MSVLQFDGWRFGAEHGLHRRRGLGIAFHSQIVLMAAGEDRIALLRRIVTDL